MAKGPIMFGSSMLALALFAFPMIADLDGTWGFHVANQTHTALVVNTAYSCSTGPYNEGDSFNVSAGKSIQFDCGAYTAADPRAVVIRRARTVLCTIHLNSDDTPIVDQTNDACSAELHGSPAVPLIDITVQDSAQ